MIQLKTYLRPLALFLGLISQSWCLLGQTTAISGRVLEQTSREPVPFAHVFLKGTQIGTSSRLDGEFQLQVKSDHLPTDTMVVSSLGYVTQQVVVTQHTEIEVILEPEMKVMDDLVVTAGENPAYIVMGQIIAHKNVNNPDRLQNYRCEEYSKIRFDLNHLTEKVKNNFLLRPFDYIWDKADTTGDGVSFLPVLLVEKQSEHYYRQSPLKRKSLVRAKQVTGLPGPRILEFVEELYFTPNIYENYMVILEKNFPSPLIDNYQLHYEYYLDSTGTGEDKEYTLQFLPKRTRDLAFKGQMTVDSASYAIKSISLRFDIMANVNFVRSYQVEQNYREVGSGQWMLAESNVLGDYTVVENSSDLTGFFGRKRAVFDHYVIDTAAYKKAYDGVEVIEEQAGAGDYDESYWAANRVGTLSLQEEGVQQMVKELKQDPAFVSRKNIVVGVATGYVPWRWMEIGDFYTFYSNNYVEDSRLKFGFRTREKLDFPLSGSVYGAYGFRDERWKYGLQAAWRLGQADDTRVGFRFKDDIIQLGRSVNALPIDHILTSFVQIGNTVSRVYEQRWSGYLERDLMTGMVARLGYFDAMMSPTDTVQFYEMGQTHTAQHYRASGLEVTFKMSWLNDNLDGDFYSRPDMKKEFRRFPDLGLQWQYADRSFGGNVSYHKLTGQLSQYLWTKSLGYFHYRVEAGLTEGTVPYPYLNTPFANQLVLYDDMAFNLMHYLEYVADRYVTAHIQQHFDGLIMDKIPLINRLKWRSFVFAKGYWGSLSAQNRSSSYDLPQQTVGIIDPYYEVGFGLENIFKIARVDFVWRLNETTLPNSYQFIVKPSFRFSF
ncbi:hypothetical protein BGP76_07780 [Reichenbachiella sp. MSK19-1]|nr:hypothetical protein BGP76_07780 [Reichenbachiella sp. MSK19-1]